jgi:hypothetical protein
MAPHLAGTATSATGWTVGVRGAPAACASAPLGVGAVVADRLDDRSVIAVVRTLLGRKDFDQQNDHEQN